MELIIYVLILFIVLGCLFKLSLWSFMQRMAYSAVLGLFAWWSVDYAMLQSKTQIADYLQDTTSLENMAIIVTIESAFGLAFALTCLSEGRKGKAGRFVSGLLYAYPSLLMFPVVFYLLTQTLFIAVGVDFSLTATAFAVGIFVLLPVLAEVLKWLIRGRSDRVEVYLLTTIFVCILGLVSTENGKIVYAGKETPISCESIAMTVGGFALLFMVGVMADKLKWKLKDKRRQTSTAGRTGKPQGTDTRHPHAHA